MIFAVWGLLGCCLLVFVLWAAWFGLFNCSVSSLCVVMFVALFCVVGWWFVFELVWFIVGWFGLLYLFLFRF